MIEPHMATMFCFLATDAMVARDSLPRVLRRAVERLVQPHHGGRGPVHQRHGGDPRQRAGRERVARARGQAACASSPRALEAITQRLARMLVEDGEGATKLVEIAVRGARTRREAVLAARSVANSPLVKTAINGARPQLGPRS